MIYACDVLHSCMHTGVCPTLSNTTEMYVIFSSTQNFVHSIASYTCKFGYGMVGPCTQTCLSTGEWSGFSPNCYRKFKLMYIHDIGYYPYQMSTCVVTCVCKFGYGMVGPFTYTNVPLHPGEWSGLLTCPN